MNWKEAAIELFQSHAGSIEGVGKLKLLGPSNSVSIPRWFD